MARWVNEPCDGPGILQDVAASDGISQSHPSSGKDAHSATGTGAWAQGSWRQDRLPPLPPGPISRLRRLVLQQPSFLREDNLRLSVLEAPFQGPPARRVERLDSEAKFFFSRPATAPIASLQVAWGGNVAKAVPMRGGVVDEGAPGRVDQLGAVYSVRVLALWSRVSGLSYAASNESRG